VNTRTQVIAAGAAVVVLAAIFAFLMLGGGDEPAATATPTPSPSPTEVPGSPTPEPTLNQDLLGQRLTVLVLGTDSNESRRERGAGVNADTFLLASVNADQSEVTLISVPRDTTNIPMPDGSTWQRKLNAIWAEQGSEGIVAAIESLLQVEIDAYAELDMGEFISIVDAAGGVTVNPPEALRDDHLEFEIQPGEQELDGATAQDYVRSREDSDYGRAARQQEVLLDLARRFTDPGTEVDIGRLLEGLQSFETTLPMEDLFTIIEIVRRAQDAEVTRQVLGPPEFITFEGDRGDGRGYILEPDIEAMRAFVAEHIGDE
jgi:LCP family protein required for cell wall assembly